MLAQMYVKKVYYPFDAHIANLMAEAARLEASAYQAIKVADADEERWCERYRRAMGVDSAGCRHAVAKIDDARWRRRDARDVTLVRAAKLLDQAVEVEAAGRIEWGLDQ